MKNEVADNKKGMSDFYVVFFFFGGGHRRLQRGILNLLPLDMEQCFQKKK